MDDRISAFKHGTYTPTMFTEVAAAHAAMERENDIFCHAGCQNKKAWPDCAIIKSHSIKIGFMVNYAIYFVLLFSPFDLLLFSLLCPPCTPSTSRA
jgi:hypothetical protein